MTGTRNIYCFSCTRNKMKMLALLSIFLTVALGMPFKAQEAQAPVPGPDKSPLVGDLLPVQGHVVMENPAPQLIDSKKEPAPPQGGEKQEMDQKDKNKSEVNLNKVVFVDKPQVKDNQDLLEQEAAPMAPGEVGSELPGQGMAYLEPEIENMKTAEILDDNKLVEEIETTQELVERHTDTEGTYEQPIMKLEPVADEEMPSEELLDTKKTLKEAFQNRGSEDVPENNDVMFGEPIMFLEPEIVEDLFVNQQIPSEMAAMEDEGPMLDALGQPMQPLEGYFPISEDFIGLEPEKDQHVEKMGVQAAVEENALSMPLFREPLLHDRFDGGWRSCVGVVLEGKCYQFFQSPKNATDAEIFCQERFPGGHLASITSSGIHNEMMKLMQQNGGYRRTWVGGLRFLNTGRFIWLDGSHWGYADWLYGEPNNTANLENCLEVLASGKFNDFTCWEPQAFICSYPYH